MTRAALSAGVTLVMCSYGVRAQGRMVQLLPNPGFEQGLEGWGLWPEDTGSKMVVDETVRHSGKASLRVDAVNAADRAQRRGQEKHVCRSFIWGRALQVKWYAYTSGGYLTTYNGNWFNPRYDILTVRYCGPALAVALNRMRHLDWMLTHSEIPQFRVCIWQPSASMRSQARARLSYGETMALHQLIYAAGFPYELVSGEYFANGGASLRDFDVVFLPYAEHLAEEHQRRLADYVRGDGSS